MPVHPVLRPDGEPLEMPVAHERLPRVRLGEPAVVAQRLGDPGELGGRRDIADDHPAGQERVPDDAEALPRGEHVENDPVDGPGLDGPWQRLDEVADGHGPRRVVDPEERPGVPPGDLGEIRPAFEGMQAALLADRPEEGHRQRSRPDAGLDDNGAGEEIGIREDLACILGIDDGGAARHRHDVVGEQRPDREIVDPRRAPHRRAVGGTDEVRMPDEPPVRVELLPVLEGDGVQPALGVGQLHPITGSERSAPQVGIDRRHEAED